MPLYDFKCECGRTHSEMRPVVDFDRLMPCPDCGRPMGHDLVAQQTAVRGAYKKPIRMESMGFLATEEDVAEHRRRFPDVDLSFEEGSAVPIIRSLGQKRRYLKESGFVDTRSF
jgi:putative FmdB family regulatory protein